MPRMGRGLRRLSRLSDIMPYERLFNSRRSRKRRSWRPPSAMRWKAAKPRRTHVRRLHRPRRGRDLQPDGQVAFDVGRILTLPVVLRCSVGSKYGAQHSQDWTALCAHIPGLKVLYPATPYDAKGLMASAPVERGSGGVLREPASYDHVEAFRPEGVPADYYRIAMGEPDVKREGAHATVLTDRALAVPRPCRSSIELEQTTGCRLKSSTRARWCRSTTIRSSPR